MIDADTISTIITAVVSLLGAAGVGAPYLLGLKQKLNQIRRIIVAIDDGFADGELTQKELKTILKMGKALLEDGKK